MPDWIHVLYLNKGEMITTNRIQDIPQKAFRVIYQKVLKLFPKLLYQIILKNKQYDIEFAAIQGMAKEILNSPLKHSKKIVWIHSDLRKATYQTYSDDDLRRFFGFDKIMVNADEVLMDFESLSSNEGESDRLVRIYNPLDTQEVLRLSNETVEECHFSKETPTFIAIGTVYPAKGYDRLLKVHKRLIDEGFHHRLLILGDGYDFEKIRKLKESLVLNDTVKLLGYVKNPYPYLKAADYFVLSSRYESFPTVLFEATILRKKIISTIVPGAEELLKNGSLGLLVENSTDGIYQGMKKALENPLSFDQYVEAFSCYDSPFILENSVQKIQQILDEL